MKTISNSGNSNKKTKKLKKNSIVETVPTKIQPIPEVVKVDNTNLPPEFVAILNNKLLQSLSTELKNGNIVDREKIVNEKDLKTLESVVSEFLKAFIVIGYNFKGEKVIVGHATSHQDHDSILEHLRQTFMKMMNNAE